MQLRTVTATIGIRGTSFDARICGDDCRQEERMAQLRPLPPTRVAAADLVVARLVSVSGQATAVQPGKAPRVLQQGERQLGRPLQPLLSVVEKRATFACTPGLERPGAEMAPGLYAAGDYVQGPYPATLEGAVRSGVAAARLANA